MSKPQERYVPNSKFGGRKERDGFVCASFTGKKKDHWFCVSVKRDSNGVHIRDTKDTKDTTLSFSNDEWKAFVKGVKDNEFDVCKGCQRQ